MNINKKSVKLDSSTDFFQSPFFKITNFWRGLRRLISTSYSKVPPQYFSHFFLITDAYIPTSSFITNAFMLLSFNRLIWEE